MSDNFYVRDNGLYESDSHRLILPLIMEEHMEKVFGLNEDINYFICYKWLMFNGMNKVASYWNNFPPDLINPIIDSLCGTTLTDSAILIDIPLI